MPSVYPPGPLPKSVFKRELAILRTIPPMVHAITDMDTILGFPLVIKTSGSSSTSFRTVNHHEFGPLPVEEYDMLYNAEAELGHPPVTAPTKDYLTSWAYRVSSACQSLTIAMHDSCTDDWERIGCAGFSSDTFYPINVLQELLLAGEKNGPAWKWRAIAFFSSPRNRHGCILAVHEDVGHIKHNQILRSELLALLCLLNIAVTRALKRRELCRSQTVFLLSFTRNQARVLEARFTAHNKIAISIRQVLEKVPAKEERDNAFKQLISWAMFVDSSYRQCDTLDLLVRLTRSFRSTRSASTASASSTSTTMSSVFDRESNKSSPDTSFSG